MTPDWEKVRAYAKAEGYFDEVCLSQERIAADRECCNHCDLRYRACSGCEVESDWQVRWFLVECYDRAQKAAV